ncbi:MAG TPA: hypothetical protein VFO77_08425 [Actinoplanes sp.]|nr:hypothetical protein [Actinoplanes sp.]
MTSPSPGPVAVGKISLVRRRRDQQSWLWTVLPAFPLMLLVLRLWYLSRQDLATMLLLVQYVSPLGMISSLVITLFWTVPAVVLVLRLLGGLLLISARDPLDATRSMLAGTALRMPDWVVVLAGLLAGLTWQLRFLPVLVMLLVSVLGLTAWQRHRTDRMVLRTVTVAVPAVAAAAAYAWMWPGIVDAARFGEPVTLVLLTVPPILGLLLTGPVPVRFARLATHWSAVAAALIAPFVVGAVFLRAPILPTTAVEHETDDGSVRVLRGHVVTVDDIATTVLDTQGAVWFVPNARVRSRTLCPDLADVPASAVVVRGWAVEDPVLSWVAPVRPTTDLDARCLGRPAETPASKKSSSSSAGASPNRSPRG